MLHHASKLKREAWTTNTQIYVKCRIAPRLPKATSSPPTPSTACRGTSWGGTAPVPPRPTARAWERRSQTTRWEQNCCSRSLNAVEPVAKRDSGATSGERQRAKDGIAILYKITTHTDVPRTYLFPGLRAHSSTRKHQRRAGCGVADHGTARGLSRQREEGGEGRAYTGQPR